MASFAKEHLKKFGWTEGKGLGKNEDGISTAIKPKLKFDTTGVGHDLSKQFTFHWWEQAFNKTAKNLNIENTSEGVIISKKKIKKKKKKPMSELYAGFVQHGVLKKDSSDTTAQLSESDSTDSENENSSKRTPESIFEELGDVTAHKAARLGIKMNGKLKRLQDQDHEILKKKRSKIELNSDDTENKKKKKKKKKKKET